MGDSFTEGMGVSTENTWPSILTTNGYSTYNLGVQGYAPIQLEGSFRKYGLQLKPNYVVIGYTASTYRREKLFLNIEKAIKEKRFTGGIQSFVNAELRVRGEIRTQVKYLVTALYLLTREYKQEIKSLFGNSLPELNHEIIGIKLSPYKKEIISIKKEFYIEEILSNPAVTWKNTIKAFSNIIKMSKSINAEVILLYLPQRGEAYFERATGEKMPEIYFEKIETNLLKEFTSGINILYIDPSDRIRKYVNSLPNDFDLKLLPYLEIDGHMSKIGHYLVAEEIMSVIHKKKNKE